MIFTLNNLSAQICNNQGNLFIFSNYDGGILTIDVDVDIPDIKIGICSYEPVQVNISGLYKNRVTKVDYAGLYSTPNNHCKYGLEISSISGVDTSICTIKILPPVGYSNPNGSNTLVCSNGRCGSTEYSGGCNTSDQLVYYFQQATGGTMRIHETRYGCWFNETLKLSTSGNCCDQPSIVPVAAFTASKNAVCTGDCIQFTNTSQGAPFSSISWNFPGGNPATSTKANPSVCYASSGKFDATLTVTNSSGSRTITQTGFISVSNESPAPPIQHKKR